jgi:hypothetical protein
VQQPKNQEQHTTVHQTLCRGYKRTQGLPKKDEHPKSFGKQTLKTKIIDSQEFLLHVGLI